MDRDHYFNWEWYEISYHSKREAPMALTASQARRNLFPLIEQVNRDRRPVVICSQRGNAVLVSWPDFEALEETAYLLRVPANAFHLLDSLGQALQGDRHVYDLWQ